MHPHERKFFDKLVEREVAQLPDEVKRLMDEVPLIIDDHAPQWLRREKRVGRYDLCGVYMGTPITDQGIEGVHGPSPRVYLFREGILSQADQESPGDVAEVSRQIRITILHEYGHHHGLDEDDLDELGYG